MNNEKGFALSTVLLVVLGIIVLGGAGYVVMNPQEPEAPAGESMPTDTTGDAQTAIEWHFTSAGEVDAMPYTNVAVVANGATYEMGKFLGSCSQIDANGGIDGTGLLVGELSGAQCWFAGGGQEIGVFGHEQGGYEIMVGELSEGDAETPFFRGDFEIKNTILF